jgi:plastocyanin
MAVKQLISLIAVPMLLIGCSPSSGSQDNRRQKHTIEIAQMKFVPAELVVQPGDTVVFVNHDIVTHDITEAGSKEWTSSLLPADEQWTFVATKSADYYCSLHPTMTGKIIIR